MLVDGVFPLKVILTDPSNQLGFKSTCLAFRDLFAMIVPATKSIIEYTQGYTVGF